MDTQTDPIILAERLRPDSHLAYRAIVVHDYVLHDGQIVQIKTFVPSTKYITVENYSDFVRLLNEQLDYFRSQGWTPRKVYIEQGGIPCLMYTL